MFFKPIQEHFCKEKLFCVSNKLATNFGEGTFYQQCRLWPCQQNPLSEKLRFYHSSFNPFVPNASFLYLLKTSENRRLSDIFRGQRKGPLGTNELSTVFSQKKNILNHCTKKILGLKIFKRTKSVKSRTTQQFIYQTS